MKRVLLAWMVRIDPCHSVNLLFTMLEKAHERKDLSPTRSNREIGTYFEQP